MSDDWPDDTPDPPPSSGKHCRTCPAPLPPRTRRYVGLCPACLAVIRADVVERLALRGECLHGHDLVPGRCRACRVDPEGIAARARVDRARGRRLRVDRARRAA